MIRPSTLLERIADAGAGREAAAPSLRRSILANLRTVLNTRPGSVPACPDLGIAPPHELASRWPADREEVLGRMRAAIAAGEPRLAQVEVTAIESPDPAILRLHISGVLADEGRRPFACQTTLDLAGRVDTGA